MGVEKGVLVASMTRKKMIWRKIWRITTTLEVSCDARVRKTQVKTIDFISKKNPTLKVGQDSQVWENKLKQIM